MLHLVVNVNVVRARSESISQGVERYYVSIARQASTSILEEELAPVNVSCVRPVNMRPFQGRAHARNVLENTTLLM